MPIRRCPECGSRFETELPDGTPCGLRACPSGRSGYGRPARTSAKGNPVDDRRVRSGARRVTGGYVQQRSTGSDLIDGCLPVLVVLALAGGLALALGAWGVAALVQLVALVLVP